MPLAKTRCSPFANLMTASRSCRFPTSRALSHSTNDPITIAGSSSRSESGTPGRRSLRRSSLGSVSFSSYTSHRLSVEPLVLLVQLPLDCEFLFPATLKGARRGDVRDRPPGTAWRTNRSWSQWPAAVHAPLSCLQILVTAVRARNPSGTAFVAVRGGAACWRLSPRAPRARRRGRRLIGIS